MRIKSCKIILASLLLLSFFSAQADVTTCSTNLALSLEHKQAASTIKSTAQKSSASQAKKQKKSSSPLLGNFKLLIPNKLR